MAVSNNQPLSGSCHPSFLHVSQLRRALIVLVIIVIIGMISPGCWNSPAPAPPTAVPVPALSAHGTIEPAARATIATLTGGVVRALPVRVGQLLDKGQTIAEVSTQGQVEILQAPWPGSLLGLNARLGDTLMPGATVAIIGDLRSYRVETNDVDEYLISQISPDQPVVITVEALDGRKLSGAVDTVALAQQTSIAGVIHYPVVIRLSGDDPDLRPGMTVRIIFAPTGEGL